jgi:hypothetical protein
MAKNYSKACSNKRANEFDTSGLKVEKFIKTTNEIFY